MKKRLLLEPAHRGVRLFEDYLGPVVDSCEVLVIGSGPGGAVVAKELAEAGIDVLLLEEGPPFGKADFRKDAGSSLQRTCREHGTRLAHGNAFMATLQANALGGGSLINSAICARMPEFAYERWHDATGVSLTAEGMAADYGGVETALGVAPTHPAVLGERNLRFKLGCDTLGISSEPTHRNVQGCKGSGECFTGCPNGAKKSTDVSYVPAAIRAGARVYTSVRAEHLWLEGKKVVGVKGITVEPFTGKLGHSVDIRPKAVVLAAGCMQTPVILMRSGLGGRWVGRDLQFHPGLAVMAQYDHAIDPWFGATQGYHSLHFLREGIKLEVLWAPPAVLATRLPGIGLEYQRNLLAYDRMAPFDVIVAADRSRGKVTVCGDSNNPRISYSIHPEDMKRLQRGLALLSDISWASGATAVLPGVLGIPEVLRSKADAEVLRTAVIRPRDVVTSGNHAFGTTRMSRLPKDGVVNEWGRHHKVPNLYISDTGIFAGSPAVNPMLTVMALASRVARGIKEQWK